MYAHKDIPDTAESVMLSFQFINVVSGRPGTLDLKDERPEYIFVKRLEALIRFLFLLSLSFVNDV